MAKKSGRSLMLFCAVFVFVCLILSGGSRLVGGAVQEDTMPVRPFSAVRAVFSSAPAPRTETGFSVQREDAQQRMQTAPMPENRILSPCVLSDANGNVLVGLTYMRAVYQAFVLDDGFV